MREPRVIHAEAPAFDTRDGFQPTSGAPSVGLRTTCARSNTRNETVLRKAGVSPSIETLRVRVTTDNMFTNGAAYEP